MTQVRLEEDDEVKQSGKGEGSGGIPFEDTHISDRVKLIGEEEEPPTPPRGGGGGLHQSDGAGETDYYDDTSPLETYRVFRFKVRGKEGDEDCPVRWRVVMG